MNPAFIDNMSWEMAEVYGAITDQILINLAKRFPYYNAQNFPRSAVTYQADMLAQMGQVNAETIAIIRKGLQGASPALSRMLEQVIIDSVKKTNPELLKAVKAGIFQPAGVPIVAPNQMRAYNLYYQQAAQKLNLVNTVMLESTKQAYQATVADIANRVQVTQTALDIGAGEVITGVSSWNEATKHAIKRMADNGITGFIDHGGHKWSAEAYVAMDVRTTMANTARAAVWETNQNFGNDLYSVSYHNGARPLCYPWQNKVISEIDRSGVTYDLDGNEIQIYPQSSTSYGEPAGLFGINCKHYPTPFIPGVSLIRGQPQDEEANAKSYAESQEQRRLERKIREEKRDLAMLKAQGAPPEVIKAQREKIRQTDDDIDTFCESTGRARRQNREGVYTQRTFPAADTYDVAAFERTQQQQIREFYKLGGAQTVFNNTPGMIPNVPITPSTPPVAPVAPTQTPAQNVAQQVTSTQYGSDMFDKVKGVEQSFREGMAKTLLASGNDDAIQLYGKFSDRLVCVDPNARGGAYYSPRKRGVVMNATKVAAGSSFDNPFEVAFHEFGHMIDDLAMPGKPYSLSNAEHGGKRLLDVIKEDFKAFKKAMGAKNNDELINMLLSEGLSEKQRANISDILEKCTNRSYPLGFGHGVGYHRRDGATEREFFAEVLESLAANPESYSQLVRLFPNAVQMVLEMVKGVL